MIRKALVLVMVAAVSVAASGQSKTVEEFDGYDWNTLSDGEKAVFVIGAKAALGTIAEEAAYHDQRVYHWLLERVIFAESVGETIGYLNRFYRDPSHRGFPVVLVMFSRLEAWRE